MGSLVINHNLMAMAAARNLGTVYANLSTSVNRLSSGLRVNSAADDAAGLAIRELMRSDIAVLNQGVRNASDAISMIQTAEGAMSVIDEKLIRMKELAEQSATGTYTTAQREIMNSEYQAMAAEIDRIANATNFNGVKLLDGSLRYGHDNSGMKVHFGTGNNAAEDYYFLSIGDMRATKDSGLRVGNSDLKETWRTLNLDATSPSNYLNATASGTAGLFGIQYSTDLNASNQPTWNLYGYAWLDPNNQTLSDVVFEINKGSQATGTVHFGSLTSAGLRNQTLTLNGQIFTFSSAVAASTYTDGTTGTISIKVASVASIASSFAAEINSHHTSIGVLAAVQGTTVHLYSQEFGTAGNAINLAVSYATVTLSGTHLADGGAKVLNASTFYDAENTQYELQLQMSQGGDGFQLRMFTGSTLTQTGGDVIGSSATVGWQADLWTNSGGSAVLTPYATSDADGDWSEAQNGSGRTTWDGRDILTQSAAQLALAALDTAIVAKDTARANLGALQNRLQNTVTNLQIQAENLQAAESRISDVDVATEMTTFTKNNILAQAATAMLAQANTLPQLALQLLAR